MMLPDEQQTTASTAATEATMVNRRIFFKQPLFMPTIDNNNNDITDKELDAKRLLETRQYHLLNLTQASQCGILQRCKELVEASPSHVINAPDTDNVYMMHWAALNNNIELVKYFLSVGADIDPIGGEARATPLQWAVLQGNIQMALLLIRSGANPNLINRDGYTTMHIAAMYSRTKILAYLLIEGHHPDVVDDKGVTPLMLCAQYSNNNRNPAQLLIRFGANVDLQNSDGNTALHYCVVNDNSEVAKACLEKGALIDIKNKQGLNVVDLAYSIGKKHIATFLNRFSLVNKRSLFQNIKTNKLFNKVLLCTVPISTLFILSKVLDSNLGLLAKILLIIATYSFAPISMGLLLSSQSHRKIMLITALSIYVYLYSSGVYFYTQYMISFSLYTLVFVVCTVASWYNFYKAIVTNPGFIVKSQETKTKELIQYIEQDDTQKQQQQQQQQPKPSFNGGYLPKDSLEALAYGSSNTGNNSNYSNDVLFCATCLIKRPLRSKHCPMCDCCVAKFDHHCPWINNCVGANNLKYFLSFLFWTPLCLAFSLHGAYLYYQGNCYKSDVQQFPDSSRFALFVLFLKCRPFVTFHCFLSFLVLIFVGVLFLKTFHQYITTGLTTNETINSSRYKYITFRNGKQDCLFNFGVLQNFIDLFEIEFLSRKPTKINWLNEYSIQEVLDKAQCRKRQLVTDLSLV